MAESLSLSWSRQTCPRVPRRRHTFPRIPDGDQYSHHVATPPLKASISGVARFRPIEDEHHQNEDRELLEASTVRAALGAVFQYLYMEPDRCGNDAIGEKTDHMVNDEGLMVLKDRVNWPSHYALRGRGKHPAAALVSESQRHVPHSHDRTGIPWNHINAVLYGLCGLLFGSFRERSARAPWLSVFSAFAGRMVWLWSAWACHKVPSRIEAAGSSRWLGPSLGFLCPIPLWGHLALGGSGFRVPFWANTNDPPFCSQHYNWVRGHGLRR